MTIKSIIVKEEAFIYIVNLVFLYFISLEKWIQCRCWILYQKFVLRKEKCSTNAGCPIDSLMWHLHNLLYSMTFSLSKYIFAFIWEKCFWSRSMREHEWESMFMYIFLLLLKCAAYFLTLISYSSLKEKKWKDPKW